MILPRAIDFVWKQISRKMKESTNSTNCPIASLAGDRGTWLAFLTSRGAALHEAEDVLQASLLKAVTSSNQVLDSEKLKPWFYTVLRNSFADYQRARAAARQRETAWSKEQAYEFHNISAPTCRCFLRRFDALHPHYARLIREMDLAGKSADQLAGETGQSVSGVHLSLHRARRAMRRELLLFCGACASKDRCLQCSCS